MIEGLHHVQVSCPARSEGALRAFYVGVLGMTFSYRLELMQAY